MGVCAKPMKYGDVAWKCEDCEKDSTCIICQDCFNKGDHTGHRVWLKTNVGGCCDCGDPDAWEEKGFCCDHKGFAASSHTMLAALPKHIQEAAPYCFDSLSNELKQILLQI
jgi:Putative zinc finger in N-recognin (UBR box)